MSFLYDLPNWFLGLFVVTAFVVATLGSFHLFKYFFPNAFSDSRISTAMSMVGVMATINSLLLAFTAVSVWDAYKAADNAVSDEAAAVGQMSRDLHAYGGGASTMTHHALEHYVLSVVEDEWPLMSDGFASPKAWEELDELFRVTALMKPADVRDRIILGEIWLRLNEIAKFRRQRLQAAQSGVPATLWVVVILGTVLTFLFCFVVDRDLYGHMLLLGLAAAMGLVFFFILAMDRPFAGRESVGPEPFKLFLTNADRRAREDAKRAAEGLPAVKLRERPVKK